MYRYVGGGVPAVDMQWHLTRQWLVDVALDSL